MKLSQKKSTKLYVSTYGQKSSFEITSINTDIPNTGISYNLADDLTNLMNGNSVYEINVVTQSPDKLGEFSGELVIKHTSNLSSELNIPIKGKVITDFIISPSRLFFQNSTSDFIREVKISNSTPFTLDLKPNPYFMLTTESSFPTTEAVICLKQGSQKLPKGAGEISIPVIGAKETQISLYYFAN